MAPPPRALAPHAAAISIALTASSTIDASALLLGSCRSFACVLTRSSPPATSTRNFSRATMGRSTMPIGNCGGARRRGEKVPVIGRGRVGACRVNAMPREQRGRHAAPANCWPCAARTARWTRRGRCCCRCHCRSPCCSATRSEPRGCASRAGGAPRRRSRRRPRRGAAGARSAARRRRRPRARALGSGDRKADRARRPRRRAAAAAGRRSR